MLPVLITIDTEYSAGLYASGTATDRAVNFDRAIACRAKPGKAGQREAGIFYQMDVFDRCGLKAVFFVDPLPALVWGQAAIDAVVQPIIARGHEVQLHSHTEWLDFAENSPLPGRTGRNMTDFSQAEQHTLLEWGLDRIQQAGAPRPTAFRAGNYGANDDTLRALAQLGIEWDSSFAAGYADSDCDISLPQGHCQPVSHCGMKEFPISAITSHNGQRHAQLAALSFEEIRAAITHAQQSKWPGFCIVSHSFELYNRDTQRPNTLLCRRFEEMCEWLGGSPDVFSAGFNDLNVDLGGGKLPLLPFNYVRAGFRVAEQLAVNTVFR